MKFPKRALILTLAEIISIFSLGWGVSLYWTENSYGDFSDGYFYRTTSTITSPEIKISTITDWYDETWQRRKPIKIDNTSGPNLFDYQINFTINTSNYVQLGQMREDLGDIRITDEDGRTLIPFWLENGSSTVTSIWVKVPVIAGGGQKYIYMYFSSSTATSNARTRAARTSVFDLYEDWEDTGTIASWSLSRNNSEFGFFRITNTTNYEGQYAIETGTKVSNANYYTAISTTLYLSMPGQISFYWKTECGPYEYLKLYVNDADIGKWKNGNPSPWSADSYNLNSGTNKIEYRFVNASSGGSLVPPDRGFVDKIIVKKYSSSPPGITPESIDETKTLYYLTAEYYSNVRDAVAENSEVKYTSWTQTTPPGSGVSVYVRGSPSWFSLRSSTPAWVGPVPNNSSPVVPKFRYLQYKISLTGNGSNTPDLTDMNIRYISPPPKPTNFSGMVISSSTIQWSWQDNSTGVLEEDNFLLYTATAGPLVGQATYFGVVQIIQQNPGTGTTNYLEQNLLPNTTYIRYIGAQNSDGVNISNSATYYTYAAPPAINSEIFTDMGLYYTYVPINISDWRTDSLFSFTSDISTGPVEYYRYYWTTADTYTFTDTETVWVPTYTYVQHPQTGVWYQKKPEILLNATINSATWYLFVRSYNQKNNGYYQQSIGPFYFNGSPSQITDLIASPSISEEGAVNLHWTAPYADATFNNIINGKYDIRWSNFLIDTDAKFDAATGVIISTSVSAGILTSYVITGLSPGNTYWFAIKAIDSDNNKSLISTNLSNIFLTRTTAAKVAKIVFKNSPPTTYVGIPTSQLTIECQDAAGNPLKLAQATNINLGSTSSDGKFSIYPDFAAETTYVNVGAGSYQANFYYKDIQSGNPTITADESPSQGWTAGQQQVTILPGKAVKFEIDTPATAVIGTPVNVTVRANDGYNPSNTSTDYEGAISATATITASIISPTTHYFVLSDSGQKILSWNSPNYAGAATLSVVENIPQNFVRVFFVDNTQGYIAGSEGMIKKTGDGGVKWFAQRYSTGPANALNSLTADSSGSNVIATGLSGKVLVSTDGVRSYNIIDTGLGQDLNGVFWVGLSTVYVCGNGGVVAKSTDSGFNWQTLTSPGAVNLRSIYFVNESTGFVCGDGGKIYKTASAGESWNDVSPAGLTNNLNSINFVDELTGYVCGDSGKVYKTVDGGDNWSISLTGVSDNLRGIKFVNSSLGYVVGDRRTILKTTDGGSNWLAKISSAAVNLYSVSFAGSDGLTTIAVGDNGLILRPSDGGNNWAEIKMTGQSNAVNWNGLVVTSTGVASRFLQGRSNQAAIKIMTKTLFGNTSTVDKFRIKLSGGSGSDSDVSAVKFYRDNNDGVFSPVNDNYLGSGVFTAGSSEVSFAGQTISNATFFMVLDISPTATIGNTLGFLLDTNCLNVNAGVPLAKNNLPVTIPPVDIVPSSCTVYITVNDLVGSTTVQVKQGTKDVPLLYLALKPDRGGSQASPWQSINISKIGQSIRDVDITRINIYKDNIFASNLVASGTFVNGSANLTVHDPGSFGSVHYLSSDATQYYYITADISPDSIYSSETSSVTFGIKIIGTTQYFRLDPEGANGFMPSTWTWTTATAKIVVAYDTVYLTPRAVSLTDIKQSEYLSLPVEVSLDANTAVWTKLRVKRLGDATDTDVPAAYLFRDTNGDGNLQPSVDTIIGQGNFSAGIADIIFANPENLNKTLPEFATYYISVYIAKRATEGKTVGLSIDATSYVTLGGVDIVSANNFPMGISPVPIADFPDAVETNLTDLTPAEARVDEEVTIAKIRLWAYCIARLNNLALQFQGSAQPGDVSLIKLYVDSDNDGYFSTSDILIGSATFNTNGLASLAVSPSYAVYDTSATLFIRYQLNPSATPGKTVGLGLDIGNAFTYNNPADRSKQTGFFSSSYLTLLDRRTPDIPSVIMNISNPDGKDLGGGRKQYYSNNPGQLAFSWSSQALNGITQGQYGLATFAYSPTNNTPDVLSYQITVDSFVSLNNLNLKHNQLYYIWIKAVSSDGFERTVSIPIKIDLTPPPKPQPPTTTSQTSAAIQKAPADSYWVNWTAVVDDESDIRYYQLEERRDTTMRWQVVSATIPASETSYLIANREKGKLYFYRLRAQNYAGSWSEYSSASNVAYLTLPDDLVSDLGSFPNPFDSRTGEATVTYILNSDAYVQARIYDLLGNLVKEWTFAGGSDGGKSGLNSWTWDGTDDRHEKVAMGMYILVVEAKSGDKNYKKIWKIGVRH